MPNREVFLHRRGEVGLGYKRLMAEMVPSAGATEPSISGPGQAAGGQVPPDCVSVDDVEALHKSLGVSVGAAGFCVDFSGSATDGCVAAPCDAHPLAER